METGSRNICLVIDTNEVMNPRSIRQVSGVLQAALRVAIGKMMLSGTPPVYGLGGAKSVRDKIFQVLFPYVDRGELYVAVVPVDEWTPEDIIDRVIPFEVEFSFNGTQFSIGLDVQFWKTITVGRIS